MSLFEHQKIHRPDTPIPEPFELAPTQKWLDSDDDSENDFDELSEEESIEDPLEPLLNELYELLGLLLEKN